MTRLVEAEKGELYRWVRGPKAWFELRTQEWIQGNSRRDMFLFLCARNHWAYGMVAELLDLKRNTIVQLYTKDFNKMVKYQSDEKDSKTTNP